MLLSDNNLNALRFAQSVIQQGYVIERIFFYHDAVYLGSQLRCVGQDELNLASLWQDWLSQTKTPATLCIASALKRGILDQQEAERYQKTAANMHPAFELAGLGTWLEAVRNAKQHISFA